MGKGRAPCCDKTKVKRGPWSPAEDLRLISFIQKHGHENWRALPKQAGLLRCGKSCRLRWINYLRPDVKRGNFTNEEEETIIKLHQALGNKWSKIASYFPGRTDNEIKNVWNTHLKKRLTIKNVGNCEEGNEYQSTTTASSSSSSSSSSDSINMSDFHKTKKPRIMENTQSKVELSSVKEFSSSSISSDNSNVTNSSDQPDNVLSLENDQTGSLISNCVEPSYDVPKALEEVNKPEIIQDVDSTTSVEIPLESDFDFWNMLDTLTSFQSNNINNGAQLQDPDREASQSSNGHNVNGEDENRRWLRYLENELGLEEDTSDHGIISHENLSVEGDIDLPLITDNFDYDKPKIIDTELGYYHLWPSS